MDARCAAAGWEDMRRKAVPMAATLEIPQMLQLQEGMMNGLSVVGVEACAWGKWEKRRPGCQRLKNLDLSEMRVIDILHYHAR